MNMKTKVKNLNQNAQCFNYICLVFFIILSTHNITFSKTTEQPTSDQVRIVSLGGGVTETLFALGLGKDIVAVDVSSIYPPQALKKPKVGYLRATSAEGIASMRPTHVDCRSRQWRRTTSSRPWLSR